MNEAVKLLLSRILQTPNDFSLRRSLAAALKSETSWHGDLVDCQSDLTDLLIDNPFRRYFGKSKILEQSLLDRFQVFANGGIELLPSLWLSLHNGVLETVRTDMSTFVDYSEECLSPLFFPFLNRLVLDGGIERLLEFVECKHLARFEHIWFGQVLFNDLRLQQFLESKYLTQLKSLNFQHWGDCTDKLELRSYGGLISADGVQRLAHTSSLSQLQFLDLCLQDMGSDGAKHLASSTVLESLTTLNVDRNDISDEGLVAIGNSQSLQSLRWISARSNKLSLDGAKDFFDSKAAVHLRCIDLSSNPLGPMFASAIPINKRMGLKVLVVSNCKLGGSGFGEMLDSVLSQHCHCLDVNSNSIGNEFYRLFQTNHSLVHVSAARNEIPDVSQLDTGSDSSQRNEPTLLSLDLGGNRLGDGFARILATDPIFRRLQTLRLRGNQISDIGVEAICHSQQLQMLQWIELDGARLSANSTELLLRTFSNRLLLL
jgi:Leucine-rich repeat (LRR) protein